LFEKINDYIFEYDFPVAQSFDPYIDEIVDNYHKNLNRDKGYNVPYENDMLLTKVENSFLQIVTDEFHVTEKLNDIKLWTYCQNKDFSICVNHNHVNTATINGVFYVNPASSGGKLEYTLEDGVHQLQPKPNKIYLFPYWLYHKPTPQLDNEWRIAVNIEFMCMSRALHKRTGIKW